MTFHKQSKLDAIISMKNAWVESLFARVCSFRTFLMLGSADAPYDSSRSLLKIIHDRLHIQPGLNRYPLPKPDEPDHHREDDPLIKGTWDPTKFYKVSDIVTFQGHKYQCTIAHQAQASWTPGTAASLWKEIS